MKRSAFLIILAAACLGAGLSSYRIGRDRASKAFVADGTPTENTVPATEITAEAVLLRSPREVVALKENLKHSYATCPSAEHDWILRGQTAAVLATTTTAELKELLGEILGRGAKGHFQHVTGWDLTLAVDLLREWGRRDPVAACMADLPPLATSVSKGRMAVFRDWLLRDPGAVRRWMGSGDQVPADLRNAWLFERVKSDPRDAVLQLVDLPQETRESSLLEWSTSCALQPAERTALLDAVREDPAVLKLCAGRMAASLADRSVEEAYAFVDSLELDEETAASLDDGIFSLWATREPQVAFAAWVEQKSTRVTDSFLRALDAWSLNSPGTEQAIHWMDTVEAGPAKEKIRLHFIADLTENERFEQAVRMGMSMDDREEGKRQMQRVIAIWGEKSPADRKERLKAIFELPAAEAKGQR